MLEIKLPAPRAPKEAMCTGVTASLGQNPRTALLERASAMMEMFCVCAV